MGPLPLRRMAAATFVSIIGMAVGWGPAAASTGWSTPVMVYDGNYYDESMAVDAEGHTDIAALGDTGIWFLTNASGSWTRTRLTRDHVDTDGYPVSAYWPVIAVNHQGDIAVAYSLLTDRGGAPSDPPVAMLRMRMRGTGWSRPSTIPVTGAPWSVALTNDLLAVAAYSWGPPSGEQTGTIDVATIRAGGSWHHRALDHEGPSLRDTDPSIAIDSTGRVWVSYLRTRNDGASYTLRLAHGDVWSGFAQKRVADASDSAAPTLALTKTDRPRIAFVAGGWTRYAARDSSGWHFEKVMAGDFTSLLALDAKGRPGVVTQDLDLHRIWYAHRHHGTWTSSRVEDPSGIMGVGGLGIVNGRVSISYSRDGGGPPRIWVTHTIG